MAKYPHALLHAVDCGILDYDALCPGNGNDKFLRLGGDNLQAY